MSKTVRFSRLLSVKLVKHSVICIVEKQISLINFAKLKYRWFNPDSFRHLDITTIN